MNKFIQITIALVMSAIVFVSCGEKKSEQQNNLPDEDVLIMESAPVDILISQEGMPRRIVRAPLGQRFQNKAKNTNYMLFPQGIYIESYRDVDSLELEATISANYARIDDIGGRNEVYVGFDSVVVINLLKKLRLETDTLYWDRHKQEIYNNCFSRFTLETGYFNAEEGFVSDENLDNYKLRKMRDGNMEFVRRQSQDTITSSELNDSVSSITLDEMPRIVTE